MFNKMTNQEFRKPDIKFPELFFGIVSPVGTNIQITIAELRRKLVAFGYEVFHIKISDDFPNLSKFLSYTDLNPHNRFERVSSYIRFGDHLRKTLGNEFLAAHAITRVTDQRFSSDDSDEDSKRFQKKAYIIDQLKTEGELSLLREVYGPNFFQVSVYSARDVRVDYLSKSLAQGENKRDKQRYRAKAEELVVTDEDELDIPHGQKVGKIFQLADVVVNADKHEVKDDVKYQVERFIELLFGHNAISPNRLEYGMYLAHSAALRSLDLSRQVGAAIFRSSGEIASFGANEVPKANGGTYWCDDPYDAREYKLKEDSNDVRKNELLAEVLDIAIGGRDKLTAEQEERLKGSQFMDALEYGRIIHAEMSAITDAARLGINLANATLYCTTFPCHMCSKHVVSAGITTVVFLEPYPKSLTADLHSDAVKIEGNSRGMYEDFPAVEFVPFYGITPRRYRELFYRTKRKSAHNFVPYKNNEARPFVSIMAPWYAEREIELIKIYTEKLKAIFQ
jgi:deoxycytidylate deaminase